MIQRTHIVGGLAPYIRTAPDRCLCTIDHLCEETQTALYVRLLDPVRNRMYPGNGILSGSALRRGCRWQRCYRHTGRETLTGVRYQWYLSRMKYQSIQYARREV